MGLTRLAFAAHVAETHPFAKFHLHIFITSHFLCVCCTLVVFNRILRDSMNPLQSKPTGKRLSGLSGFYIDTVKITMPIVAGTKSDNPASLRRAQVGDYLILNLVLLCL